jgi:hypothetical protein
MWSYLVKRSFAEVTKLMVFLYYLVGLKSNNKCPYKRKAERNLRNTDEESPREGGGRDESHTAKSQGILGAPRSWASSPWASHSELLT